ncbi:choice-of-anchor X domain-containing protein [Ramlibacter sp.]|uniref:choice-of-anchor X domain-containing protein n=1 Tax=Ramlibacter sp. TaxID=1917967 RepID=UPI0035B3A39E
MHAGFSDLSPPRRPARWRRLVAAALAFTLSLPGPMATWAANHPLTHLPDVNTINYVVNVDWDFDNPPTQVGNPAQRLDRDYITQVLRSFAQTKFTMTEGRHRVGAIHVYGNRRFGDNVDIRLINTDGRSSAHVAGWGQRGSTSYNHLTFEGRPETVFQLGRVIAHEIGHYTYGLYDEYREAGTPLNLAARGAPSEVDTARNSIMNDHLQWATLSTPADYADPSQRQTAQARVYATRPDQSGGSAWETLTRPAAQDPEAVRGARTFFEAFAGIDPATLRLTQPTAGFDAALQIVFVPNPVFRDVIVLDRTLPAERYSQLIQAVRAVVSQAGADTQFGIVVSPPVGSEAVVALTTANDEGKRSVLAALDSVTPTAGAFDATTAFNQAIGLIRGARQPGDVATVHLLTGSETSVPQEVQATVRGAQVVVNALGLTGGSGVLRAAIRERALKASVSGTAINLSQLALASGGAYNASRDGADAARDLLRGIKEAHAQAHAILQMDGSDPLPAGGRVERSVRVASGTADGNVQIDLFFDPADASALSFSLVHPSGQVITPGTLPQGVQFDLDAADGVASFLLESSLASRAGNWKVAVQASRAMSDGIGLDVRSDSAIVLAGAVSGGTAGAAGAPVLRVRLGGEKSIRDAVVTADIYQEDGSLALGGVELRDDGTAPDDRAGDGLYAVSLAGRLPAGEYFAIVEARTTAASRIASLGALIKGARNEEAPVDLLVRVAEVVFALDSAAPGVMQAAPGGGSTPAADATDGGGGCVATTTGRDGSLALLLALALVGMALRRRALARP